MWWFTYTALGINLLIIWFMPKRLTHKEIYVTWFVIAVINLSSDIVLDLYFHLYQISSGGVQLRVHLLEWTLGASYGVIYLNFMPKSVKKFIPYLVAWTIYSLAFETVLIHINYISYTGWRIWYSLPIYIVYLVFLRWHIHYIRK